MSCLRTSSGDLQNRSPKGEHGTLIVFAGRPFLLVRFLLDEQKKMNTQIYTIPLPCRASTRHPVVRKKQSLGDHALVFCLPRPAPLGESFVPPRNWAPRGDSSVENAILLICHAVPRHGIQCRLAAQPSQHSPPKAQPIWIPAGVYPAERRDGNDKGRTGVTMGKP